MNKLKFFRAECVYVLNQRWEWEVLCRLPPKSQMESCIWKMSHFLQTINCYPAVRYLTCYLDVTGYFTSHHFPYEFPFLILFLCGGFLEAVTESWSELFTFGLPLVSNSMLLQPAWQGDLNSTPLEPQTGLNAPWGQWHLALHDGEPELKTKSKQEKLKFENIGDLLAIGAEGCSSVICVLGAW